MALNADEMVATLKATANNAIGFAFQLAIDSISAQIGGVMKDMSQRVQALNAFNMSSCEAAQQAIGSIWPKMDGASSTICQQVGGAKGFFSDAASARHGCTNKGEREDTIAKAGDAAELVQWEIFSAVRVDNLYPDHTGIRLAAGDGLAGDV